jgi:hypothetical protein
MHGSMGAFVSTALIALQDGTDKVNRFVVVPIMCPLL